MEKNLRPVISVRLFSEEKAFGPGIATLLERVKQTHSLRAAAMSMEMAYSKAWSIIKNAEQALGIALLNSTTGGRNGGGATLTPEAETILAAYQEYCKQLKSCANQLFAEIFEPIL